MYKIDIIHIKFLWLIRIKEKVFMCFLDSTYILPKYKLFFVWAVCQDFYHEEVNVLNFDQPSLINTLGTHLLFINLDYCQKAAIISIIFFEIGLYSTYIALAILCVKVLHKYLFAKGECKFYLPSRIWPMRTPRETFIFSSKWGFSRTLMLDGSVFLMIFGDIICTSLVLKTR